ncbi:MAG: hypothetical protein ACSHYC_12800 [Alphaproteobacteria bacterium]
MNQKKFLSLLTISVLSVSTLSISMANGASGDEAFCNRYTDRAISQQKENVSRGCGFSGNEWNASRSWHFDWCMRVEREPAHTGNLYRINKLSNECKGATETADTNEAFCQQYTASAQLQNRINRAQGCGFTGPEWSNDFSHHFDWCVTTSRSTANRGHQFRENKLAHSC